MVYRRYFEAAVSRLKDERRYRVFAHLERDVESFPLASWHRDDGSVQDVTVWCSNDYLGMGQHPEVISAMVETAGRVGAGAGGTRNISGTSHAIVELERELADLHGKEAALVFTSGWISNLAAISTIADLLPNCLILSDASNHNSMIEGVKRSRAERKIFRHNDLAHLEELLIEAGDRPKLIVFESLYSMNGNIAPVAEIAASRRALWRDDLCRRGSCGRHVWRARRRHLRARRRDGSHRRDRGHARQGLRRDRRLCRRRRRGHRRDPLLCRRLHLLHRSAAGRRRGAPAPRCAC